PPWAPPPQQASLEVPSSQVTMTMPPLPYQLEASTAGRLLDSHLSLLGRPQSVLCPSSQRLGLTQMKGVARPLLRSPSSRLRGTSSWQAVGSVRRWSKRS